MYDYLISIKTFNRSKDKSDWHEGFGLNFKITDLQSSLGLSQFSRIEHFINKKLKILNFYKENIKSEKFKLKTFKQEKFLGFLILRLLLMMKEKN